MSLKQLEALYPDALFNHQPEDYDEESVQRLRDIGMGVVDVWQNGTRNPQAYIIEMTPHTKILSIIASYQACSILGNKALGLEIRSIAEGTFDESWKGWMEFFAGQQG